MSKDNIESEFQRLTSKNEWSTLFQNIRSECAKSSRSYEEALKPQNKNLNRYRDVSPYDHSRIILCRGSTDYINANLVKVDKANRKYILTQGPLVNTVSHFWLMVWEQGSKAVLMLNKLVEKKVEKCYQYWPSETGPDHIITMKDVGLSVEYLEQRDFSYYLERVIKLTDLETKTSRDIIQYHYTTWPDFGVPSSPLAFLEFLRKVRDAGVLENNVGPAIVHCSAGIGRSGTFCLVDSCLVLIEKFGLNFLDIKEILHEMRSYRMGLIQTHDQLRFSYQAIIEGAKQLLNSNGNLSEDHIYFEESNNESGDVVASESDDDNNDDDDGPPPLPPPRLDSLKKQNGIPVDRPLPKIPNSVSLNDIYYGDDEYTPSGLLPAVPTDEENSSEDDVERENTSRLIDHSISSESMSQSEIRHRKRIEQKEKLEAQLRDIKKRQQANEHWTQLKRSLYKPLFIAGTVILGGGLIAYLYFKN